MKIPPPGFRIKSEQKKKPVCPGFCIIIMGVIQKITCYTQFYPHNVDKVFIKIPLLVNIISKQGQVINNI